jgi:hypothetical protein
MDSINDAVWWLNQFTKIFPRTLRNMSTHQGELFQPIYSGKDAFNGSWA